jgi:hypothetical protein
VGFKCKSNIGEIIRLDSCPMPYHIRPLDGGSWNWYINNLEGTHLTSQEGRIQNEAAIFKRIMPTKLNESTKNQPALLQSQRMSDKTSMCHITCSTSIGGNNFILYGVDEYCDFVAAVPMQ